MLGWIYKLCWSNSSVFKLALQPSLLLTRIIAAKSGFIKDLILFQSVDTGLSARKQALVDNIDAWAMWISPPVFVLFNCVYWIAYRHADTEL